MQCFCVTIPLAVTPTISRQMDTGSLTCTQIWVRVCRTHEGGSGTNKSAQELTRTGQKKTAPHPAPPWDRTQSFRIWIPTHKPLSYIHRLIYIYYNIQTMWGRGGSIGRASALKSNAMHSMIRGSNPIRNWRKICEFFQVKMLCWLVGVPHPRVYTHA